MTYWVEIHNRIIIRIHIQIQPVKRFGCNTQCACRTYKPTKKRIIVPRLEIVQSQVLVIVISSVSYRVFGYCGACSAVAMFFIDLKLLCFSNIPCLHCFQFFCNPFERFYKVFIFLPRKKLHSILTINF